eukprot:730999-Prymnesium_polylepis.1
MRRRAHFCLVRPVPPAQPGHPEPQTPDPPSPLAQTIPPTLPHRCLAGANRQRQRQFVAPHR